VVWISLSQTPFVSPIPSPYSLNLNQSQGYTRFATFFDLNAPTTEDWDTCYAVNVKAQVFLMREVLSTFNSNSEGGVFIMTSSIAGKNPSGSSMPYSVTKAAQLHLLRCLASTQGPKIRTNAVLPGVCLLRVLFPFQRTLRNIRYGCTGSIFLT
jgi:NAD(P)-dependent dehydrogenase (short-subunit alcohol dehydrogenase family)